MDMSAMATGDVEQYIANSPDALAQALRSLGAQAPLVPAWPEAPRRASTVPLSYELSSPPPREGARTTGFIGVSESPPGLYQESLASLASTTRVGPATPPHVEASQLMEIVQAQQRQIAQLLSLVASPDQQKVSSVVVVTVIWSS